MKAKSGTIFLGLDKVPSIPRTPSTVSTDETTGNVIVRKASGKVKIRKGQSQEEYSNQLYDYFELNCGPRKTEENWMDKVDALQLLKEKDLTVKMNRQLLNGFCARLYYQKRYQECLLLTQDLLQCYQKINYKNKLQGEIEELEYMAKRSALNK